MFEYTISETTKRSLEIISQLSFMSEWYLAGGTAAALQLGHRTSLDLDFFTRHPVNEQQIIESLLQSGNFVLQKKDWQTIHGDFNTTKVSFIHYNYPLLFPMVQFCNVPLVDVRDIACMKLDAIASRGSKKDFIDMYRILQEYSLQKIVLLFQKKYESVEYNIMHTLKSLTYFEDAEQDPLPHMFIDVSWEQIKNFLTSQTKALKL